jgi:hypothetical protein
MALATATGRLGYIMPYISHKKVPTVNTTYMDNDMPDVSFVRIVFTACGKKDIVVLKAAIKPIISM